MGQTAVSLATADRMELEGLIRPTGFYRQKARFIQEACRVLVQEHGGDVPAKMGSLLELTGVARKTANVVLGEVYGLAEGIAVDTHVKRLSGRLGLTTAISPGKIEQELMAVIPPTAWIRFSHQLIYHGRHICLARRPRCGQCPLADLCPAYQLGVFHLLHDTANDAAAAKTAD